MALRSGHTFVARAIKDAGVYTLFYLSGGSRVFVNLIWAHAHFR